MGVVIPPNQASAETFVTAIKQVLEDPAFRHNVQRMKEAIRSTDGLSIAAGVLERAFELEDSKEGAP